MPQDLPGFYFNAEKHRCFPIEDPTPGSSRPSSTSAAAKKSAQTSTREMDLCWVTYVRASKLLQIRELYGNVILFKNRKRNFKEEFRKIQVSQPAVWKYSETDKIANGALEKIHVDVQTPEGLTETDALLADHAWPFIKENQAEYGTIPGPIHRSARGSL